VRSCDVAVFTELEKGYRWRCSVLFELYHGWYVAIGQNEEPGCGLLSWLYE
jgi:hypothetical protein